MAHGMGLLDLQNFEPFPKNPSISKVFREIGIADELGSRKDIAMVFCNTQNQKVIRVKSNHLFCCMTGMPSICGESPQGA